MNDFAKRARAAARSRHPVRDVVGECLVDIRAARKEGLSWEKIYRQLIRDGKAVGAGPSSLSSAFRHWEGKPGDVSQPVKPVTNYGDTRHQSDF